MKENPIQNEGNFDGISEKGNFPEALANAITRARQELRTSWVEWKLIGISGENGGFSEDNKIIVRIQVASTKP